MSKSSKVSFAVLLLLLAFAVLLTAACANANYKDVEDQIIKTNKTFWNIYLGAFLVGILVLLISFLIGLGEHDWDLGHHEIDLGHGGIEVGHGVEIGHGVEAGHHEVSYREAGPSWLSLRLVLMFLIGFGAGGVIGLEALKLRGIGSLLAALALAFICYFAGFKILQLLWKQQVSTQLSASSLLNTEVTVIHRINPGGVGEIRGKDPKTSAAQFVKARGEDPSALYGEGEVVIVKKVISGDCVVSKKEGAQAQKV
ncbi:MAG TPA: hypothetical protein VJ461_04690 [Candidatus Nanoarchaeia archaeon]|nr:hypothetical protein [Candidatus Nanoarchaeia archaeon]